MVEGWVLHHLATAGTLSALHLHFVFNYDLRNALGLLGWSLFCTYSLLMSEAGRVEVAVQVNFFLAALLQHGWVGWLHPCVLRLVFSLSVGKRIRSELLRLVFGTLATSTTADFLSLVSESKTVALEIGICGLHSGSKSLRIAELGVTAEKFRRFVEVIDDVVVDVVVVDYVGHVCWLGLLLSFWPALICQPSLVIGICDGFFLGFLLLFPRLLVVLLQEVVRLTSQHCCLLALCCFGTHN